MAAVEPMRTRVDDIPLTVLRPAPEHDRHRLALWLHFLGGSKEAMAPFCARLATAGFTAVSLDAWQHGDRATEEPADTLARVLGRFRAEMWPILGHTTLDALRVVDWALTTYDLDPTDVRAGGVSMGGDLSVALAGVDPRVRRVAAVIATPDWTRPGMTVLDDPTTEIDQGEPTPYGAWCAAQLDPMRHLDAYDRDVAIAFDLGGADRHVPAANAEAFAAALAARGSAAAVTVRTHPGLDHLAAGRDATVLDAAFDWLTAAH